MAELDTASIVLIVLALLIAPWVLPRLLRALGAAAKVSQEHREFMDRLGR